MKPPESERAPREKREEEIYRGISSSSRECVWWMCGFWPDSSLSVSRCFISPPLPRVVSLLFLGWSAHKFSRFSTFISLLPSLPAASQGDSLCPVQCTRFVLHDLLFKKTYDKTWLQAMSQLAEGRLSVAGLRARFLFSELMFNFRILFND